MTGVGDMRTTWTTGLHSSTFWVNGSTGEVPFGSQKCKLDLGELFLSFSEFGEMHMRFAFADYSSTRLQIVLTSAYST